ncbi:MAG: hypothetical protein R3Y67_06370 [Eubacteriales bacterium]
MKQENNSCGGCHAKQEEGSCGGCCQSNEFHYDEYEVIACYSADYHPNMS